MFRMMDAGRLCAGLVAVGLFGACEGPVEEPPLQPEQDVWSPPPTTRPPPVSPDASQPTEQATPGSYLHHLEVDLDPNAGPDLDGDGAGNNAVGALFSEIGGLLENASVNDELANAIEGGELSLGMLWTGLDPSNLSNPIGFQLTVVDLQDTDQDPTTSASFTTTHPPGAATPGTPFPGVSIVNGAFSAGPTPLPLSFPYFGVQLTLDITQTRASGTVAADPLGIAVPEGTFTGVVDMATVTHWANDFVLSPSCACLQGSGALIDISNGFNADACVGTSNFDSSGCTGAGGFIEGMCKFFADSCIIVVPLLAVHADIDTDGDSKADAHSAVLHFQASGAEIQVIGAP